MQSRASCFIIMIDMFIKSDKILSLSLDLWQAKNTTIVERRLNK